MARERRLVFGEDAEAYERWRPTYPEALFDDVVAYAGAGPGSAVLEVGAGTGKATRALLARGLAVTCVEPDPDMARVLARVAPAARIETVRFELLSTPAQAFALLCSAQAWHWVDPQRRAALAYAALAPGGAVALWWAEYTLPDSLREAIDEIYERREPELLAEQRSLRSADGPDLADELAAAGFVDAQRREYGPSGLIDADAYVAMAATTSSHMLLSGERRDALLAEVRDRLAAHGEPLPLPARTRLWLARRLSG